MLTRFLPVLVISSLLTVGVLGFFGLGIMNHGVQHTCPIAVMSGGDCLSSYGSLELALHHIDGLIQLTQSGINPNVASLILLVLLVSVYLFISGINHIATQDQQNISQYFRRSIKELSWIPQNQLLQWLAVHYKRDPHASLMVYDKA